MCQQGVLQVYKYGNDSAQYAQLTRPDNGQLLPVVIVLHGGYWKNNHSLDTYPTKHIVDELKQYNVAVWNLEYRRMNFEGDNITAPWPATFLDVMEGIDFLPTIAAAQLLDLNRVMVIGHSAGGHLATWAASRESIATSSELFRKAPLKIQRLISISGVLDLQREEDISQPEQIHRLLGIGSGNMDGKYQACNPNQLHNDQIPITIVHGEKDQTVSFAQALYYKNNAAANVELIGLPNADHFDMLPLEGNSAQYWPDMKNIISRELLLLINDKA